MGRARNLGVWGQRIAIGAVLALVVGFAVRVGSSSSQSLDYRDPFIWLVSAATGEVVQADSGSGEITARVPVGKNGHSLQVVQRGADAFVLNRTTKTIGRIDGSALTIDGQAPVDVDDTARLLARGDHAAIVTGAGVIPLDPLDAHPMAPVAAPPLAPAVLDAEGTVWGLDGARALVAVGASAETLVMPADTRPFGLVATSDEAYLLDGAGPALVQLDGSGRALGESTCVGGQLGPTAVVGGSLEPATSVVVMVDPDSGVVRMSDLVAGECTSVTLADLGGARFGTPVESDGYAYIPVPTTGEIVVVRVSDGSVIDRHEVVDAGRTIELEVKDGIVWFNDPDGPKAGVIDRDGVRDIDKFRQVEVGGLVEEQDPQPGSSTGGNSQGDAGEGIETTGSNGTEQSPDEGVNPGDGESNSSGSPQRRTGSDGIDDGPVEDRDLSGLVADFTYSKRVVEVGETVNFVDRSSGGPTGWTWEFGDGSFSTGPRADHAWAEVGAYTVTLRIETATGAAAASVTIEVIDENTRSKPNADFLFSASRVEVGQTIEFTSRTTGNPDTLEWDFGDGNGAEGESAEHTWDSAGTYMVALTATNALGSDTSDAVAITVYDRVEQPNAVITAGATSANINQTITFQSQSTGNPTEIRWGFGDGAIARGESVSHAWTAPGNYTVELFVSNSAGESSTTVAIRIEDVVVKPIARIDASTRAAQVGQPIRFTSLSINNPTRLSWDFGDGTSDVGSAVTHEFDSPGRYPVTLRASNAAGESSTTEMITVTTDVPEPIAGFSFSPDSPVGAGVPVQFSDASSGGSVTRWRWDFGDKTPTSSQRHPAHIFADAGTYTVTLTVENGTGTDEISRQIVVRPPRPEAAFTYGPLLPNAGDPVQFTDTTRGGTPTSWTWDFGDGSTSTLQNPSHAFAAERSYTVTLTVRNEGGSTTTTRLVEVNPAAPDASFSFSPAVDITTETLVRFTHRGRPGAGEPATYQWVFSDGQTSEARNPSVTFAAGGQITATLTVGNAGGSDTAQQTVSVAPVAAFEFGAVRLVGQPLTFEASRIVGASYAWDFGREGTGTGRAPSFEFSTARVHQVTLTVTVGGVSTSVTRSVEVWAVPTVEIAPLDEPPVVGIPTTLVATVTDGVDAVVTWYDGPTPIDTDATAPFRISYAFSTPGAHTVRADVSSAGGGTASGSLPVTVQVARPTASFTYAGSPSFVVGFDAGGSLGAESYEWDFDGDGVPDATGPTPEQQFPGEGAYDVTLTVRNSGGSDSQTQPIRIFLPGGSFSYDGDPGAVQGGSPVEFRSDAVSTGGPILSWVWSWGDLTPDDSGPLAQHTFASPLLVPQIVTVTLTVSNQWGSTVLAREIVVLP